MTFLLFFFLQSLLTIVGCDIKMLNLGKYGCVRYDKKFTFNFQCIVDIINLGITIGGQKLYRDMVHFILVMMSLPGPQPVQEFLITQGDIVLMHFFHRHWKWALRLPTGPS